MYFKHAFLIIALPLALCRPLGSDPGSGLGDTISGLEKQIADLMETELELIRSEVAPFIPHHHPDAALDTRQDLQEDLHKAKQHSQRGMLLDGVNVVLDVLQNDVNLITNAIAARDTSSSALTARKEAQVEVPKSKTLSNRALKDLLSSSSSSSSPNPDFVALLAATTTISTTLANLAGKQNLDPITGATALEELVPILTSINEILGNAKTGIPLPGLVLVLNAINEIIKNVKSGFSSETLGIVVQNQLGTAGVLLDNLIGTFTALIATSIGTVGNADSIVTALTKVIFALNVLVQTLKG